MTGLHNVFLSYARKDAAHADKLRRLLNARRDVRLLSTDDLSGGQNWQAKLKDALVKSDLFVLMVSPDSLTSPWVVQELGAAWALEKPILVVVAGTTLPMRLPVELERRQFARIRDFRKPEDFDRWLERSGEALAA
ncbi:MAG: toll/interleukin-1 receptor domain-containing protein [Verrucomicrobia bacterium]|nr:toll/interleukin-1 receptor domain-containing protein [Verrucomicrobiota bacterium]